MNSTPTPKATEPHDAPVASADERLAHAHEQIVSADEQLTRLSEQLAKIERDAARPPSAAPDPQGSGPPSLPRWPVFRALVGLPLAACVIVAALVLQSSYGDGGRQVATPSAPQPDLLLAIRPRGEHSCAVTIPDRFIGVDDVDSPGQRR